ncbi:unnamed protein product [Cylicocyclus nassatus]|uniref:Uncharacterized protein n=1 Tax=Cylicocyclus nassatus TaxID=53992 RepID=A0AA36GG10_CYLNA|nr:unnamed protein product [Cylicocyclus nassatus]
MIDTFYQGYSQYRETIYIVFGIVCLISWLAFNVYAVRDYFCPIYFRRKYSDITMKAVDDYYRKFRQANTLSLSLKSNPPPQHNTSELDRFIV